MSMHWSWNGWTIRGGDNGDLLIESPSGGGILGADQVASFADMLVACSTLLESRPALVSASAVKSAGAAKASAQTSADTAQAGTTAPAKAAAAKAAAAKAAPAKAAAAKAAPAGEDTSAPASAAPAHQEAGKAPRTKAAEADAGADTGRSRQGTTLRIDGQPVKRGPKAAAARFSGAALPAAASTSAASEPKEAARALAKASDAPARERSAAASKAAAEAASQEVAGLPGPLQEIVRGLDPRARLLRPLVIWMAQVGRGVTMDEIIAAANQHRWSNSPNPQPAINASMQKHAHLFIRDQLGAFTLRAGRPEGKVIRRRSAVTSAP